MNKNNGKRSHGMSRTPEYRAWNSMHQRCENKKIDNYCRYGGRGIRVCKKWEMFLNFYKDMGKRPSSKHSLDRVNNDGIYKPSNCRWVNRRTQNNNRSNTLYYAYKGISKPIGIWSKEKGIKHPTLKSRIDRGWGEERIFSAVRKYK